MKLHITKSVGKDEYLCPNCGARVKYSPQRKKLAIHNLPLSPGKRCPATKLEAELQLDPHGPMPELLKLEERPLVKDEPDKGKRQRRGRFRGPRDPQRPSRHWRNEYAIQGAESKAAEAGTKRIEAAVTERCRLLHFLYAQSRVLAGIPAGAVPRRPHTCC